LEQIVQQILLVRRDLSREEVLKRIYEKKRSAEDYYLDEAAARVVASELGVEIPYETEAFKPQLRLSDLISGLNDVTVTGRVILIYPAQVFRRPDLTEGRVVRLQVADKTGTLRLVLWNDKTTQVEGGKISSGQMLRVLHGYVREGLDGKLELHVGQRGEVQVSPPDIDESEYPSIASFVDKIGSLAARHRRANVLGVVQEVHPASEFKRRDGTSGRVRRLTLKDETAQTTVVLWNEKVDELGEVKKGDYIRIMNARLKEIAEGRLELHVENATQIEKVAREMVPTLIPLVEEAAPNKISDIKDEGGPFTIEGKVASTPTTREVVTSRNEKVKVTSFDLTDQTGRIRVSLWRKLAEVGKDLAVGTQIRIKDAYAKRGFSNLLELVSRASTTVEILPRQEAQTEKQN